MVPVGVPPISAGQGLLTPGMARNLEPNAGQDEKAEVIRKPIQTSGRQNLIPVQPTMQVEVESRHFVKETTLPGKVFEGLKKWQ